MNEDLVTIIMPIYNTEKYLKKAINSVINQTYLNWELILINDGSKDNCLSIIQKYLNEKIKIINLKNNNGVATARNIGLKNANGKYIAFLDSDDLWHKEKLYKQIKFMKDKNITFSFSSYERINDKNNKKRKLVNVPLQITYEEALKNTIILTSTVIIDVEKIDKELLQMPTIKRTEDTATWYKILKTGIIAYGYNENSLVKYRCRKTSLSANKIYSSIGLWRVYRDFEGLSIKKSIFNMIRYFKNAIKKRVYKKS